MKRSTDMMTVRGIFMTGLLLVLSLLIVSCNESKTKISKKDIIPEKEFTAILQDIYMANGLLSFPRIREKFAYRDSVANYIDVIEKYGYDYDAMNRTVRYYFISNPKKLVKIYDKVLGVLSEMETRYEKESSYIPDRPKNTWKGRNWYNLPDTSKIAKTGFTIPVNARSSIIFEFTVTLYPDDQSVNPRFVAWYCNADSAETGKRTYIINPQIKYFKDGQPRVFTLAQDIKVFHPVVLRGSFIDVENDPSGTGIHATVSGIYFNSGPII